MANADYDHDGDAIIAPEVKMNRGSRYAMPRLDSHGTEHNNRPLDHGVVATKVTATNILTQWQLHDQDYTTMPVDGLGVRQVPANPTKRGGGVPVPPLQGGQLLAAPYQGAGGGGTE